MVVLSVRISSKLLCVIRHIADEFNITVSDVVRQTLETLIETPPKGLEHIAQEAIIDNLVRQLDWLDHTQRKMLRSGAFLAQSLPRHWSPTKRWAVAVKGEERDALERLLGEREHLAQRIATLVKETYKRKARIVLLDRSPWYKLSKKSSEADE